MFDQLITNQIVVHFIGNKSADEGIRFSSGKLAVDDDLKTLLSGYFAGSFKSPEFYHFAHPDDLKFNEVYNYVSDIFDNPGNMFNQSINLAKHLYEHSTHPNVKSGEFYTAYFYDCLIEDQTVDAVGLFKSENKDTFLKMLHKNGNFEANIEEGINISKLDKGCLIFNTEKENGYLVAIVDNTAKNNEARFWKEDFLQLSPRADNYHHTQNLLSMCKNFVVKKLPETFEVNKAEQADMLNRSVKFFKENDAFSMDNFTSEVIQSPAVISVFNDFKKEYAGESEMEISEEFDISAAAVKKQQRIFKSVIKLDKNFHIYIHGDKNLIERGFDETTGMQYYKMYFKEEN